MYIVNGLMKIEFFDCIGGGLRSLMTFRVINIHISSGIIFKIKHVTFTFNTKYIVYIAKVIISKNYYFTKVPLYLPLIILCTYKPHRNNVIKIKNITSDKLALL